MNRLSLIQRIARQSRVATTWSQRQADYALNPMQALRDLQQGDGSSTLELVNRFGKMVGVDEQPGDWGYSISMTATWVQAASKPIRKLIFEVFRNMQSLYGYVVQKRMDEAVKLFNDLVPALKKIIDVARSNDKFFQHGPFKVIPMKGISGAQTQTLLEALDLAAKEIHNKFPQILYGDVYLSTTTGNHLAHYVPTQDVMTLNPKGDRHSLGGNVYTIIHELGHRYDARFWTDKEDRQLFRKLSTEPVYATWDVTKDDRVRFADDVMDYLNKTKAGKKGTLPEDTNKFVAHIGTQGTMLSFFMKSYMEDLSPKWADEIRRYMVRSDGVMQIPQEKIADPIAVTPYGGTNPTENFAEAFAHYVLGLPLDPAIKAIMDRLK